MDILDANVVAGIQGVVLQAITTMRDLAAVTASLAHVQMVKHGIKINVTVYAKFSARNANPLMFGVKTYAVVIARS